MHNCLNCRLVNATADLYLFSLDHNCFCILVKQNRKCFFINTVFCWHIITHQSVFTESLVALTKPQIAITDQRWRLPVHRWQLLSSMLFTNLWCHLPICGVINQSASINYWSTLKKIVKKYQKKGEVVKINLIVAEMSVTFWPEWGRGFEPPLTDMSITSFYQMDCQKCEH